MGICGRLTSPVGAMDGDGDPGATAGHLRWMWTPGRVDGLPSARGHLRLMAEGDTSTGELTLLAKLEDNIDDPFTSSWFSLPIYTHFTHISLFFLHSSLIHSLLFSK